MRRLYHLAIAVLPVKVYEVALKCPMRYRRLQEMLSRPSNSPPLREILAIFFGLKPAFRATSGDARGFRQNFCECGHERPEK
jgi:hypothetical protein